jgi:hypothetical protein
MSTWGNRVGEERRVIPSGARNLGKENAFGSRDSSLRSEPVKFPSVRRQRCVGWGGLIGSTARQPVWLRSFPDQPIR